MLGKCFSLLVILSFFFGVLKGDMRQLSDSILLGASKSVTVVISIIGFMALWNGVMEVLKDCGLISKISKLLRPILKHIFPHAFKTNEGCDEITACVSANLLGLSNATTPLALSAIEKMNKGRKSKYATNDMIILCILGCACFNLVPTTVISMRISQGASITYEIIAPVWICSFLCMALGIILCKIIGKINGDT